MARLDCAWFRERIHIILEAAWLDSVSAQDLLLGTAAQESHFGKYVTQMGNGPARGVFQMEGPTYNWIRDKYAKKYPFLHGTTVDDLAYDSGEGLDLAIIMCRLRYFVVPKPLPVAGDIEAYAAYWKKWYNTPLGAGKPEEFVRNYARYVTC